LQPPERLANGPPSAPFVRRVSFSGEKRARLQKFPRAGCRESARFTKSGRKTTQTSSASSLRKGQSRVTSRQSPVESPVGQSDFEADRLGGWRLTTKTDD